MKIKNLSSFLFFLGLISFSVSIQAQDYLVDPSFNPTFSGRTHQFWDYNIDVAVQPDQKILVGGNFTIVNGDSSSLIVRLNPNGTRDTSFNSGLGAMANDLVENINVLSDGKILVAGVFRVAGALTYFARLNSDGSVDGSFTSAIPSVKTVEIYPDGKLLVGGCFSLLNEVGKVARLNQDGSVDTSFQAHVGGNCTYDVALSPDGSVFAGGTITSADGLGIRGLVKLNPNGSRDTSFNQPGESFNFIAREFFRLALQPDGQLIAAYKIWYTDSQQELSAAWGLNRYSSTGSYQSFPNCNGGFETGTEIFLQDDGRVITNACRPQSNSPSYWFGRLQADGTFDSALNRLSFNNGTRRVARQADGSYVVVGSFTSVDGISRQRIVRLVTNLAPPRREFDFDGDGKDDLAVFRPSDRYWYLNRSTSGFHFVQWGLATDNLVAGDHDNDGKADVTIFRDGYWYILRSSDNTFYFQTFGQAGDKPLVGDVNGDGNVDMVIRRLLPTNVVEWQVRYFDSGVIATQTILGENFSNRAMVGDFDGDNADEVAFFRDGQWYSRKVIANAPRINFQWGQAGDIATPGDYDRDGQTDYAVFRPSDGNWYIRRSTAGFYALHFGMNGDQPVPADYDGDGNTDIAVFRNGAWYQLLSSTGAFKAEAWGLAGDVPIPAQGY
jgi:uncharacterized delta-60 repeat protein